MTDKKASANTRLKDVLDFFSSMIRSKYFWRGFFLLFLIGFFVYLLYSDITLDFDKKKITSKGKMKSDELNRRPHVF